MAFRFAVIPAIPSETGCVRNGTRFYSSTVSSGYNIYDNQEKCRLPVSFPTRGEADDACDEKNSQLLLFSKD